MSSSSSSSLSSSSSSSDPPAFCPDCGGLYNYYSSSSSSSSLSSDVSAASESSSSRQCHFIECGADLATLPGAMFADCGLIEEPGYTYVLDCAACECVRTLLSSSSSSSSSNSSSSSSSSRSLISQPLLATDSVFGTNIATINLNAGPASYGHRISIDFKILPGVKNNAGLILNYKGPEITGGAEKYFVVLINVDSGTFSLLRYTGSTFIAEYVTTFNSAAFPFDFARWYRLSVLPISAPEWDEVTAACALEKIDTGQRIAFNVTVGNFGALTGMLGLYADRSYTYFDNLKVE